MPRFTSWGAPNPEPAVPPAEPASVLEAAGKASRGEPLTEEEQLLLGRRVTGGAKRLRQQPAQPGLETIPLTPDAGVETAVAGHQGAVAWVSPQAAALMPENERPDVTGIITLDRDPDMSNPHVQGVTFWLYRWWGRDASTGKLYLLYVGETQQQPVDRLIEHLTSRTAPARYFKHLLFAWEVDPRVFPSKKAAQRAEATAIRNEFPARNSKGQIAANHRWTARKYRKIIRLRPVLTPGLIVAWSLVAAIAVGLLYLTRGIHARVSGWWELAYTAAPIVLAILMVFIVRRAWHSTRSKPTRKGYHR